MMQTIYSGMLIVAKTHRQHKDDEEKKKLIRAGLNPRFIEKQKCTEEDIDKIVDLHLRLDQVKKSMEALDPEDGIFAVGEIQDYGKLVEEFEFALQEAWGFEKSADHHSHWYDVPHCSCPKMDNRDNWGTPYRIMNVSCIVHGGIKNVVE